MSSSNLKDLLKDPQAFYDVRFGGKVAEKKQSNSFDEGSLTHTLILEPHLVASEYSLYPGMRRQGAEYEAFASTATKPIITKPMLTRCESYKRAFMANPIAVSQLEGCKFEETICVELEGVLVKARFDSINVEQKYIADVKTSSYPVSHDSWRTTVSQWNYDLSAAFYCMIASKYYGVGFSFFWQAINKNTLECEVYKCSDATMQKAVQRVNEALNIYKNCVATGDWSVKVTQPEVKKTSDILEV